MHLSKTNSMDQLYRLKVNVILKETSMTKRKAFRSKAITNEEKYKIFVKFVGRYPESLLINNLPYQLIICV
jgi:hypothetical protein